MTNSLGMTTQLAGNVARFGWYWGINRLFTRAAGRYAPPPSYTPQQSTPSYGELMADVRALLVRDAEAVRDGVFPPVVGPACGWTEHLLRVSEMFADLPDSVRRRHAQETSSAAALADEAFLPEYIKQDFHYQRGGHLSEDSARLYDVQVETLFLGTASAMRRAALRPLASFMRGKVQREVDLLDVACGTGRFLREVRLAYPVIRASGIDLSAAYLAEAQRHLAKFRAVRLTAGNAEDMPYPDATQDIVTACFLYHELPPEARRRVTSEIARVLKPGGLFILTDSLQYGDRPGWDGLVEAFPHRFHEPYYEHYASDDLASLCAGANLNVETSFAAFLSKIVVSSKSSE